MSLRLLLGLILCNLLWSANPVMGKFVLADFAPPHAAWLRYGCAFLAYLAFALLRGRKDWREIFCVPDSGRDRAWLFALGFLPFCFSTLFLTTGLSTTTATDNALIIAMEPLVTVLIAWLLIGEPIRRYHLLSLGIALAGFSLLSGLGPARLRLGLDAHLLGNLLILVSLIGEGAYSSCARKLQGRFKPVPVFGSSLAVGLACLTLVVLALAGPIPFQQMTWKSAMGTLYLGVLGTTVTYLFWLIALVRAPIPSIVVTLFVQPVAGAIWGVVFLDEYLSATQLVGGLMILLAISIPTAIELRSLQRAKPQAQ